MSVADALERAKAAIWTDEDNDVLDIEFLPGVQESELEKIESGLGVALPTDYRELLLSCRGINGAVIEVDFVGLDSAFGMPEILPHAWPFATDGFGNFWVVDCLPTQEEQSAIFFACHDAPVLLFQCIGIDTFISELTRWHQPNTNSLIVQVPDDELFNVWRTNPGTITNDELLESADPALREFGEELDQSFLTVDLRSVPPGMGFSWGRYGPNTLLYRSPANRLFAYGKPPPKGLFSWLKRGK